MQKFRSPLAKVLAILSAIVLIITVYCLIGTKTKKVYDISDYGKWTKSTNEILNSKYFTGILPSKEAVKNFGTKYIYSYNQSVLGDPNFYISVTLEIPEFEKQIENIREAAEYTATTGQTTWYFMKKAAYDTWINEYLNSSEINDAMFYSFEIVEVSEDGMIRFTSAHVWDYFKDEYLYNYLKTIDEANIKN